MGVPSFFWWLINRYPKVLSGDLQEKDELYIRPEFDNFYVDLNEIIHSCFHPDDDLSPPATFDEVFSGIYDHIDRLFEIVKPQKLLFMAIDGVAPRAKMNLIRSGRFGTLSKWTEEIEKNLRKQFEKEGKALLPEEESEVADANVITPGTEFMHILSQKLQRYIKQRMSVNPAWGNIKVILSDDKVPGEGEHKIMSFIRAQRSSPGYDPNTRHCVHGLDADLIMLALATHEIHFSILREEPIWRLGKRNVCQFVDLCVLREYLAVDLEIPCSDKFEYDVERIIDDFIFLCFFAGNDFIPRMPSLATNEGCIDLLMRVYKEEVQNLGGYLVDMQKVEDKIGGYIDFKRVERFILAVSEYEDKIFSKRSQMRERKLRRIHAEYRAKDYEKNHLDEGRASDFVGSNDAVANIDEVSRNTMELNLKLSDYIFTEYDLFKDGLGIDKVRFGTRGWKERYYKEKFSAQSPDEIEATRKDVVAKYGEGLCWVLLCYFSGVPSWSWFYPHYYGPLASDLKGLSQTKVEFQKGLPFKPFDQLVAVLPPRSAHALPAAYKELVTHKNSKIIDFYPTEYEKDFDGQRYPWQGISKLPFIEEERLLTETRKLENELKEDEKIRNLQTLDILFVRRSSKVKRQLSQCETNAASKKIDGAVMMDSPIDGIKGTLHVMPEELIESNDGAKGEGSGNVLCMFYEIPEGLHHLPQLLEGVNIPVKTVNKEDIVKTNLWHETHNSSSSSSNSNRFQNQRPINQSEHSRRSEAASWRRDDYGKSVSNPSLGNRPQPTPAGSNSFADRPQPAPAGSHFWQSRSGVTYHPSDDWRLNKPSDGGWQKN